MAKNIWRVIIEGEDARIYAESREKAEKYAEMTGGTVQFAGRINDWEWADRMDKSYKTLRRLTKHGRTVKECPHCETVTCIDMAGYATVKRDCNRCAWGPRAESIYLKRITAAKKRMRKEAAGHGERAAKLQTASGRDLPQGRE